MSSAKEAKIPGESALLETIQALEKRISHLEQSAHTEHTIGPEAVYQLVQQVIQQVSNRLAQPAE